MIVTASAVVIMEQVKLAADVFQSVSAGLALIVGGIWAVYTFRTLRERARAEVLLRQQELEANKFEAELRKLEREAQIGAVLDIDFKAEQLGAIAKDGAIVRAAVTIRNHGLVSARLPFGTGPFWVSRVTDVDGNLPALAHSMEFQVPMSRNPASPATSVIVRPGAILELPFIFQADAGLYFLRFASVLEPEERERARNLGATAPTSWTAQMYFLVKETPE